nr:retrotransposon protein, putative, unclassified [Tanacetum cinerariifolium]
MNYRAYSRGCSNQRGIIKIWEEVGVEKSTELGSNDTEEMVNVLSSMEAANILTSGVAAVSVSPVAGVSTAGVPTVSGLFPTASVIFTTASVVTPYTRRSRGISAKDKGKQDSKIARLHAEKELKRMIEGLDRRNEVIAKHLQEYKQAKTELTVGEKLEMINELVKYQDHHAKILKYQAQQSRPLSKKEQREFYMSFEDFVPMSSKEEAERVKRKGLKLDQGSAKRIKTFEDVSEEDLKGMMQLVPLEEVYVEALLGGHTAVYQFFVDMLKQFDREDLHQLWTLLWTHTQALMHDPLDWKLYDTCGVYHVSTKDREIFMLVERDYPLRRGLATVMICNKLQVSQSLGGIFINQSKFAFEILKKFGMSSCDPVDTPMVDRLKLDEDPLGILVNQTRFRSMVGSLMYLIASRPDLVFAVCMCARYQASPTKKHLEALKQMQIKKDVRTHEEVHPEVLSSLAINWSKHIDIRNHFIREKVEKGVVKLYFVTTDYHLAGLSQVEGRLVEFKNQEVKHYEKIRGLEFKVEARGDRIECLTNELELIEKEKEGLESKLIAFQSSSKDLDSLLESQRSDKNKEGLGYSAVPPPTQVYSPPKKDLSWIGILEFADDTIIDYSRPSPVIESTSDDVQNRNSFVTKIE